MPQGRLIHSHLPYCLERLPDGRWIVLNRAYKPMGTTTPRAEFIDYGDPYALAFEHGELDRETQSVISTSVDFDDEGEPARLYIYQDDSSPMKGPIEMEAYLERLAIMANLRVKRLEVS